MTLFNALDYTRLSALAFAPDYPGYRPWIVEAPNGDGKLDRAKRFAHVAFKYLAVDPDRKRANALRQFFGRAFIQATNIARRLNVPLAYFPSPEACALRILEYPAGAGSELHTDFDLFTLMLYRDQPDKFVRLGRAEPVAGEHYADCDPMLHIGELGEIVGLGRAEPHLVLPGETPQHSIVFFALPAHETELPGTDGAPGETVAQWVARRLARSRYET